jgi:outer membrane lipoprotein SlyB
MKHSLKIVMLCLLPLSALAGDLTTDAAIGGAIGGAVGGAVGAEVGGRDAAVIGAGVGAAAGTAIMTRDSERRRDDGYERRERYDDYHHGHSQPQFCPPGQAKKGRC